MPHRRSVPRLGGSAASRAAGGRAHHGWAWAEDEEFAPQGVSARGWATRTASSTSRRPTACGSPRSASPGATPRAGLTDDMLAPGVELTLEGHRSRNPEEKVMKAERVVIAGRLYNLYPDRS